MLLLMFCIVLTQIATVFKKPYCYIPQSDLDEAIADSFVNYLELEGYTDI